MSVLTIRLRQEECGDQRTISQTKPSWVADWNSNSVYRVALPMSVADAETAQ